MKKRFYKMLTLYIYPPPIPIVKQFNIFICFNKKCHESYAYVVFAHLLTSLG